MLRTLLLAWAIPAVTALSVAPVALFGGEYSVVAAFVTAALVFGGVAGVAYRSLPGADQPSVSTKLALVAGCWVELALAFGVLTWIAVHLAGNAGGAPELTDLTSAVFESVSGVSTTGLTMLDDPSDADAWLQWWRSITQWFGAIGMVLFAAVVAEPSGDHDSLVGAEWGDTSGETTRDVAARVMTILVALTVFSVLAMIVFGDPVWRAVNHGITASATGGFAITSDSAAASGPTTQVVLAITMLVSAVSFGTIWDRAQRVGVPLWHRTQLRWAMAITATGIGAGVVVAGDDAPLGSLVFNAISASTTGGFALGDSFVTNGALGVIATIAMLIGGAAGSTAGGIKVARVAWIGKAIVRWLPGDSDVDDTDPYEWDDQPVEVDDARHRIMGAAAIIATWIAIVGIGTTILAEFNPDVPAQDLLFDAVSAGSGVGLSRNVAGADANGATKSVLTVLMLAGRVEMTAFVILLFKPLTTIRGTITRASPGAGSNGAG